MNEFLFNMGKAELERLVLKHKKNFSICKFCNIPISEMQADELRAVVCEQAENEERLIRNHIQDLEKIGGK